MSDMGHEDWHNDLLLGDAIYIRRIINICIMHISSGVMSDSLDPGRCIQIVL